MRRFSSCLVFVLGLMFLFSVQPAFSQTAEGSKAQDLNKPVESKPAAAPGGEIKEARINIKGAPMKGDKNAKLVLIEFSDYQ